ncbi:MAG: PQQ-binding-like beta-propeller repeat protein [Nibricoccus sp.]
MNKNLIFVGAGGVACAIDKATGAIVWKYKFPSNSLGVDGYVNLLVDGDLLYAHASGELHCIKAATGELLWRNPLKGMGYGIGSIAAVGNTTSFLPQVVQSAASDAQSASTSTTS